MSWKLTVCEQQHLFNTNFNLREVKEKRPQLVYYLKHRGLRPIMCVYQAAWLSLNSEENENSNSHHLAANASGRALGALVGNYPYLNYHETK